VARLRGLMLGMLAVAGWCVAAFQTMGQHPSMLTSGGRSSSMTLVLVVTCGAVSSSLALLFKRLGLEP
jgi:hypothetical protein